MVPKTLSQYGDAKYIMHMHARGRASLQITLQISKGLTNLGDNFPLMPNLWMPFIKDTLRRNI